MTKRKLKKGRRKQFDVQQIMIGIGAIIFVLVAILGGTYLYLNKYISAYSQDKVAENIYVGPICAQDMTKEELKGELVKHLESKKTTKVTLLIDKNREETTLEELGFSYSNIDKVVEEAFFYDREKATGTFRKRDYVGVASDGQIQAFR